MFPFDSLVIYAWLNALCAPLEVFREMLGFEAKSGSKFNIVAH